MFIPDQSPYSFNLPRALVGVECIGWLDPAHPFQRAETTARFLNKLLALIKREPVNEMRGIHECPWCSDEEIWLESEEPKLLLGNAEVWVPDPTRDVVFAAPNLIFHFCSAHGYRPPDVFVAAVNAFDVESEWSGRVERRRKIEAIF